MTGRGSYTILILPVIVTSLLCSCKTEDSSLPDEQILFEEAISRRPAKPEFPEERLVQLLDSAGKLSPSGLEGKLNYRMRTVFNERQDIGRTLSDEAFELLKANLQTGHLTNEASLMIFGVEDCCGCTSHPQALTLHSFDKDTSQLDEFAVSLGCEHGKLYFFKSKKMICSQLITFQDRSKALEFYKDKDGHSIVYYTNAYNLTKFYKYTPDGLVRVLEIPATMSQNVNFWRIDFKQRIVTTDPLTFDIQYSHELTDSVGRYYLPKLVGGSARLRCEWDNKLKYFVYDTRGSGINDIQLCTFYPMMSFDQEIYEEFPLKLHYVIFLNAYYKELTAALKDSKTKKSVLHLLDEIQYKMWLEEHRNDY